MQTEQTHNVDTEELAKFSKLANEWWDTEGPFKTLHDINPVRLDFIKQHCHLAGKKVIDVGCGGGILTEGLAQAGAVATGIDLAEDLLSVAKTHQQQSDLAIDYQHISAETIASQSAGQFDVVCCLEMLEHVPDPASIVRACQQLVKKDGYVFFSTLNRHPKAYLFAILGAEYCLGLLPKGTHDYQQFIRPSELTSWTRQAGLETVSLKGMQYNPLNRKASLCEDVSINYLLCCRN